MKMENIIKHICGFVMLCAVIPYGAASASEPIYFDLTDPNNVELADKFSPFESMALWSFGDTFLDSSGEFSLAYTAFCLKADCDDWDYRYTLDILKSNAGELSLYLHDLKSTCESDKDDYPEVVFSIFGSQAGVDQNVSFRVYCDGKNKYYSAKSTAGKNFLVNSFKENNIVTFTINGYQIPFDAEGFEDAWKALGGDAL